MQMNVRPKSVTNIIAKGKNVLSQAKLNASATQANSQFLFLLNCLIVPNEILILMHLSCIFIHLSVQ